MGHKAFQVLSVNISDRKGVKKSPVDSIRLEPELGIVGDAHAGNWHRQVSLLAIEDIDSMRNKGMDLDFGDFAENITTRGIDLSGLPLGTRLFLGGAVIEITQIGKECHQHCAIYRAVGDCVMPRRGVFAKVIESGEINCETPCHYDL